MLGSTQKTSKKEKGMEEKRFKCICYNCGEKSFTAKAIDLDRVSIKSVAWICDNCDCALMDNDQMNVALSNLRSLFQKGLESS